MDEVYAYLEAHHYKVNRVQIVVEEFLGMTNKEDDHSRSAFPDISQLDKTDVFQKGKGVGKKSKIKAVKNEETIPTSSSSSRQDPAEVETVQEAGAQLPPDDPAIPAPSEPIQPEAEVDPSVSWELEKHSQLLSMFPDLCPDFLLNDVVRRAINSSAQSLNVEQLDTLFAAYVERMFAMRPEERRSLPTRSQWETNRKEKEELEKWSGNMSVNDMLLLYSDDPAGHYGNPDRKPESELYKQHAVEGLKNEFRFVSFSSSPLMSHFNQFCAGINLTGRSKKSSEKQSLSTSLP